MSETINRAASAITPILFSQRTFATLGEPEQAYVRRITKAVAAQVLRDVIEACPTYTHEDENGSEYWLPDTLRLFAAERGIDLSEPEERS